MTLSVSIAHRLGNFMLDARFEAEGGLIALFGPSGSGKTSIVKAIAGLMRPECGRISIGGEVITDTATGIFIAASRRRIGYVFQEARLFPHLTVRQNLLYGSWFAPSNGRSDEKTHLIGLHQIAGLLDIGNLLDRRPSGLSGGEVQRVAIGRALLSAPRLLLMDEPLAALDEARKAQILPYIERLRDELRIPIVYVSHSVAEVARLATAVVMLSGGRVIANGPPSSVFNRVGAFAVDDNRDAGSFITVKVLQHDDGYGLTELSSRAGLWRVPRLTAFPGQHVTLRVRAADVTLASTMPSDVSTLNIFPARVREIGAPNHGTAEVGLDCNGDVIVAKVTQFSIERMALQPGLSLYCLVKGVSFDGTEIASVVSP